MWKYVGILFLLAGILSSCGTTRETKGPSGRPPYEHHKGPTSKGKVADGDLERNKNDYLLADNFSDNKILIKLINEWLGVPYRFGGKTKEGIDCSGFTSVLLREVYHINFTGPSYIMAAKSQQIKRNQLEEGDLVFFKIGGSKVSHVGVYLSNDYFVHATVKRGVIISSLNEPYYARYYFEAGRVN
ncbi:MAG: C40 family peptidase [Saprospiraceae bacterium]|nr:C40 family peptidase [Saprospiraceae bacterium]